MKNNLCVRKNIIRFKKYNNNANPLVLYDNNLGGHRRKFENQEIISDLSGCNIQKKKNETIDAGKIIFQ